MTAAAPTLAYRRSFRLDRTTLVRVAVAVAVIGALLAGGTYLVGGCHRMLTVAPRGSAGSGGAVVTGYGWSWSPPGFTVRYSDGSEQSRLWW
ncbi:hypothetical protein GCM10009841_33750 [Microlunatus panaciterrae]|uniref:Uncharacterized protein n=1 Tax=Microlunatus panaciterrae TaxID=400768 RepID=A0ABS2RJ85_9ACTN|nr:hypothetical protein [Microlunatus panaciterrae]MBM7798034.1 hypothetical protein [Microlunatus panaciterrae]